MKLIALRGFKNNAKEVIVFEKGTTVLHPDGVHKGARFSIGGDFSVEDLQQSNQRYYRIIRELDMAKCVGDASDTKLCAKVDAEVVLEQKQRDEAAAALASGSTGDVARQVAQVLAEYGLAPAKKPASTAGAPSPAGQPTK